MNKEKPSADPLIQANRLILVLLLICLALIATTTFLFLRPAENQPQMAATLRNEELREEVITRLVAEHPGIYDSHVDADVGRINLPNMKERRASKALVSTNRFGIREHDYDLPKPDGVVRVVLLGDSFIFGFGVTAEDRLGSQLETWLNERRGNKSVRVECLHIGVPSWNFKAAAAYLRRQISLLAPDLVLHISLPNDVEETTGTRGFGEWSSFSPQVRERADSSITAGFPTRELGFRRSGFLRHGLDYESQNRYAEAVDDLRLLTARLAAVGTDYRILFHFRRLLSVTYKHLGSRLEAGQALYLASSFGNDRQYWNSPQDHHWNPDGHRRMAKLLYGLISRDGLLPSLDLEPWPEADQVFAEIAEAGQREAARDLTAAQIQQALGRPKISRRINFKRLNDFTAAQIHGGIDKQQRVSPYASFILRNDVGRQLRLVGRSLPRPELDGTQVRIFLDALQVGQIELRADTPIREIFEIPAELRDRPFLSVRLESSDYGYAGLDLQHCVVFRLDQLAIES